MYKSLMKIFFKENFGLRRILGTDFKKQKAKTILLIFLLIYGLGAFVFSFGYMFFDLGRLLAELGAIDVLLIYAFTYASVLAIMFVLFRANGYLFNYKDYEILEPMPIKTRTVIFAKMTVMLAFIYFSVFLFLSPIAFSYFYHHGFEFLSLLYFIIGFFTIPIIPTVVFSFVSLLISSVTSRFRKNNIINIIVLFIVFLGIMYLSFSIQNFEDANPLLNQQAFMDNLSQFYPPIRWFVGAVTEGNIGQLLLLLAVNIALFAGFVFGIQGLVRITNQRGMTKITRKNTKAAVSKQRSTLVSIATKEFKTFFNIPIYALNVGFGAVIMVVLGVASIFFVEDIRAFLGEMMGLGLDFEALVLILIGFCISMTYSTAISLSLEGKHFWILKSLPIAPKTVMQGKMAFNLVLTIPPALITILATSYSLQTSALRVLVMILVSISLALVVTVMGSIINLYVPKFEYRNPAEVVKQSAGALFGLFGSWIILFGNGLIYYLLIDVVSFEFTLLIITAFNLLLFGGFMWLVNQKAESIFIKLEV